MTARAWNAVDGEISRNLFMRNKKSPSPVCLMSFWIITLYSDTLHQSVIAQVHGIITDLDI